MKKLFFLTSLFLVINTQQLLASSNSTSNAESIQYWNKVLVNRQKKLSYVRKQISIITSFVDEKNLLLNDNIFSTELKFQELKFILLTGSQSPYMFRLAVKKLSYLYNTFRDNLKYAKKLQLSLKQQINVFDEAGIIITKIDDRNVSPNLKESIAQIEKDISEIIINLRKSNQTFTKSINGADELFKLAKDDKSDFDSIMLNQLKFYFLTPNNSLISADTWKLSSFHIHEWKSIAYESLIEKIPDSVKEWLYLLIFLLIGFFIFTLIKKVNKRVFRRTNHKLFTRTCFWFILAATLTFYNNTIMIFPETLVTYLLSIICIIRGIMTLSWGLKSKQVSENLPHPLEPLFCLYVYGIVIQTIDFPSILLIFVWIVGLIITTFFIIKKIRQPYPLFEKAIIQLSILLCFLSLVSAIIGYIYISILAVLVWFIIILGLKFGINICTAFKTSIKNIKTDSYKLTKIFIQGFGIPLIWCIIIFSIFLWFGDQLIDSRVFLNSLDNKIGIGGFSVNLVYFSFCIYLFFVFRTIINVAKNSLIKLTQQSKIDTSVAPSITLLISYGIWTIYAMIILKLLGVSFTSLAVLAGGLGIGLGIGLKDIINNFASGLIILAGQTIKHNDVIQIDNLMGKVNKITIRSTVIQTYENAILSIPNSQIISNRVINWTHNNKLVRRDILVNVAYNSDIDKINDLLLKIAHETEHILKKPEPTVLFQEFRESALSFVLRIWLDDIDFIAKTPSILRTRINELFKQNGIVFVYPQLDLHIKQTSKSDIINHKS